MDQCVDRLRYAPRVYAAAPAGQARRLVSTVSASPEAELGVLGVASGDIQLVREAQDVPDRREPGKAHVIERQLRSALAEGEAEGPR